VTVQQLIEAFASFGEIDASKVAIHEPKQDDKVLKDKIKIETNYGFIKFENSEGAKKALQNSKSDEKIKNLYHGA